MRALKITISIARANIPIDWSVQTYLWLSRESTAFGKIAARPVSISGILEERINRNSKYWPLGTPGDRNYHGYDFASNKALSLCPQF